MADSESEEVHQVLNAENRWMWGTVTNNFLTETLQDGIISLNISSNHLTRESAELLSNFIKSSNTLAFLDISETRLTQDAANTIFASISESTIIEFFADDNVFPYEQCQILAQALSKDPPLEILSLCSCEIPSEGGIALAAILPLNHHLKHLRLESNSLYDTAALKFKETLPQSSLISLNLADNEIWNDGTTAILSILHLTNIESLDLSYNMISLQSICSKEVNLTKIKELALSGCKVDESLISKFLNVLPSLKLEKLILDGLHYQTLPISWSKVKDTVWSNPSYFDDLMLALQQIPTLNDLRVGFFEMEQIFGLRSLVADLPPRKMIISMHSFGYTENCWIVHLPELVFESPTTTFRWNSLITQSNCKLIGEVIKNTKVIISDGDALDTPIKPKTKTSNKPAKKKNPSHSKKSRKENSDADDSEEEDDYECDDENIIYGSIDTIDLHDMKLNDTVFIGVLEGLNEYNLKLLDCSDNSLGDASLEAIRAFLRGTTIEELDLSGNVPTDLGCQDFIIKMMEEDIEFPAKLNLSFTSKDMDQFAEHGTSTQIGNLIKANIELESLYLGGPITATDAINIIAALPQNQFIKELELQSDHIKNYMNPDPDINDNLQQQFEEMVSLLHSALSDKKSKCKLKSFIFPLLTEVFIYTPEICEQWQEIEKKLQQNA